MKNMNDQVKYQLQRAEDALRTALTLLEPKDSVYVISAISKALIEIDNSLFAERIEEAVKKGNTSAIGISVDKEEQEDGSVKFEMSPVEHLGQETIEINKGKRMTWQNEYSFVPAQPTVSE